MNAYTVSRLALDAGVSVHIVRDYLLRGLLRPVACTPGGYGLFDDGGSKPEPPKIPSADQRGLSRARSMG